MVDEIGDSAADDVHVLIGTVGQEFGPHRGHVRGIGKGPQVGTTLVEQREAALVAGGPHQRAPVRPSAGDPDWQRILHRSGQKGATVN
jgi:hypothetical protein